MVLNRNTHQGMFGELFFAVLASAAGLSLAKNFPDEDGSDFTVTLKGEHRGSMHPKVDVQVKSWTHRKATQKFKNGLWHYRMKAKHFNNLAGTNFSLRRFLILVVVPDEWANYATTSPDAVRLQYAAYWMSLRDRDRVDSAKQATVAVPVPVANQLTVPALRDLVIPQHPARTGT